MEKGRQKFFVADAKLSIARVTRPIPAGKFTASASGAAAPAPEAVESIATLTGYPIVWNAISDDRGGYFVRCLPNSAKFFTPTLAYWNHDCARVLGNTANNTLRLTPDTTGVKVEIDLPGTSDGRDAETLVSQGYVAGMSFAMVEPPEGAIVTENGQQILNVTSFLCDEVTITGIPAFVQTTIQVAGAADDDYSEAHNAERLRFEKLRFDFLSSLAPGN
jgi:HK97 family phage prohead protease